MGNSPEGIKQYGRYVNLTKEPTRLVIELTDEGRQEITERREDFDWSDEEIIYHLLECFWTNGWNMPRPEQIGALTDGNLITDDWEQNDNDEYIHLGDVFWEENYMVRSTVDDLLESGVCYWSRNPTDSN